MEHLGKEQKLDLVELVVQNKSQLLHVDDLLVESEAWFAKVVGLQNWDIDLRKDVNHVYNKDLQLLFEDKIFHKGLN